MAPAAEGQCARSTFGRTRSAGKLRRPSRRRITATLRRICDQPLIAGDWDYEPPRIVSPGAVAAVVMLAACAGSGVQTQPLAPQGRAATHGLSWMTPDAGGKKLLYVSYYSSVLVYDYGTSNQVGQLSYFSRAAGSCTDPSGDVYVTNYGAADIIELRTVAASRSRRLSTQVPIRPTALSTGAPAISPSSISTARVSTLRETSLSTPRRKVTRRPIRSRGSRPTFPAVTTQAATFWSAERRRRPTSWSSPCWSTGATPSRRRHCSGAVI